MHVSPVDHEQEEVLGRDVVREGGDERFGALEEGYAADREVRHIQGLGRAQQLAIIGGDEREADRHLVRGSACDQEQQAARKLAGAQEEDQRQPHYVYIDNNDNEQANFIPVDRVHINCPP